MRITSFHIDGFGAFAGFGTETIGDGVVVVLGPNEAGKSTLFDFLTGVLFGFPSRRDNPRFRAPVRGGRHGGRVAMLDEDMGQWVVERHAGPQRGLTVRLPDGSEGDEESLRRALAGASLPLFEAVFAVGLDELGHLRSLESDEVRELLFTASILGQRRSATAALRRIEEARNELARPRREDARANRLAAELESIRSELATAREDARRYESLDIDAATLERELTAVRSRLRIARERQRELQLLDVCWQQHRIAEEARRQLAALPDLGGPSLIVANATSIRKLADERSGHIERLAKLEELRSSGRSIDASLQRRLARLGPSWTLERALEAGDPEYLTSTVRASRDRLDQLRLAVASAEGILAQARSEALIAPPEPFEEDEPPSLEWLDNRERALAELRDRTGEAELLAAEAVVDERASAEATWNEVAARATRSASALLVLCGLVVVAFGGALLSNGRAGLGAGAAAVGGLLVAIGLLMRGGFLTTAARSREEQANRRAVAVDSAVLPPVRGATAAPVAGGRTDRLRQLDRAQQLERARARVTELSDLLGLGDPPSRVDVEQCAAALQRARERRRLRDAAATARAEAERRSALAVERLALAERALQAELDVYGRWCKTHGFDPADSPVETLERLDELAEIAEAAAGRRRVEKALAELEPLVSSFTQRWRRLLEVVAAALPTELPPPDGSADDTALLDTSIGRLAELLEDASNLLAQHASLKAEQASAEAALAGSLGAGSAADRLRSELADGDVLSWSSELGALEETLDELRVAEERLVREHQSVAEEMRSLAASERIAQLEQRRESLEAELDVALRRYLVLGTAQSLLRRTLARHERERQPAVVAQAAAHFQRVTGGRYVGLLADSAADGRQGFRALSASGEAIEAQHLSRGTIEQLYLCLRLGLADSFAERSVSLPIVLDDVLVNFDPERAAAVADELAESSRRHQVIFLTCHPHLAEVMMRAASHLATPPQLIRLDRLGQPAGQAEQLALAALAALPDLPGDEPSVRSG